jgi:hypothetical protein
MTLQSPHRLQLTALSHVGSRMNSHLQFLLSISKSGRRCLRRAGCRRKDRPDHLEAHNDVNTAFVCHIRLNVQRPSVQVSWLDLSFALPTWTMVSPGIER